MQRLTSSASSTLVLPRDLAAVLYRWQRRAGWAAVPGAGPALTTDRQSVAYRPHERMTGYMTVILLPLPCVATV